MNTPLPSLDPLLHQPTRTQIVAFLSGRGEATFSELKRVLNTTDGNLGSHLGKLTEAGFITSRDAASGARAQSMFMLTPAGRAALAEYVAHLSSLMGMGADAAPGLRRDLVPKPGR